VIVRRCVVLMLIGLAASCRSSPPKRFYVLDAVPAQQRSTAVVKSSVQIAAVNIPPSLDREEMVRESAPDALEVSDVNRWGAPLADMTQNVLTRDLVERLPAGKVIPPRIAAAPKTYEITVDILQFGTTTTTTTTTKAEVRLQGGWSLYRLGSDTPLLHRNVEFNVQPPAPDYAGQAQAMSQLLGKLADDMVATLRE